MKRQNRKTAISSRSQLDVSTFIFASKGGVSFKSITFETMLKLFQTFGSTVQLEQVFLSARGDVEGDLETVAKSSFQRREILFKKKIEFRGNVKISDLTST